MILNLLHIMSQRPLLPPTRLPDTSTTHHITSDLRNLVLPHKYNGLDLVTIGDGSCLQILNIGSSYIPTFSKPLSLSNVLQVPSIHRNLLSISKLTLDNVFVEFHPEFFCVKDQATGMTLLRANVTMDYIIFRPTPVFLSTLQINLHLLAKDALLLVGTMGSAIQQCRVFIGFFLSLTFLLLAFSPLKFVQLANHT